MLFETAGRASEAEVVGDLNGVIHVFWAYGAPDNEESGAAQAIYYVRQQDGQWSEPVDILISSGDRVARMHAVVSDPRGYLHITWSGGDSIFYSRAYAPDAGNSRAWTQPKALTSGAVSLSPAIAHAPTGELYVLWSQGGSGLMFVRSEDGGQSWSDPSAIFEASGPRELAASGRIAVDEAGRLHVVFTYAVENADPANTDLHVRNPHYLYYMRSDDQGKTWTEPLLVVPEPRFGEINVAIYGSDTVHLAWNGRAGRNGRYHRWSEDGGESWSNVIEVLPPAPQSPIGDGGLTGFPALATDATGALHMVSATGGGDYYFRWDDGAWSSPVLISPGLDGSGVTGESGSLEQPSIAISQGNQLHAVFHDGFERIWHTSAAIDAPYEAPVALPTPVAVAVAAATANLAATPAPNLQPTPTPIALSLAPPPDSGSTFTPLLIGVAPALLLVGAVVLWFSTRRTL